MEHLHVIAGLPRSGSTLLCNLLNQRAGEVWATSTSTLPGVLASMSASYSNNPEMTGELANIPEARERNVEALRAVVGAWFEYRTEPVIVDKSRAWGQHLLLLRRAVPEGEASAVVLVRHPCEVLASAELRHRETAEYFPAEPSAMFARCRALVADQNGDMSNTVLGAPMLAVEDLIRRRLSRVKFITYNRLVNDTYGVLSEVAELFGLDPEFRHDLTDVANTSTDLDALWRYKWPHEGAGPIEPSQVVWQDIISRDIAEMTLNSCPLLCETFGFRM